MKKIANSIRINGEVKTGFVRDENGNPTTETYLYRTYDVLDEQETILETGEYTEEEITVEQILARTGIQFGLSAYFLPVE